MTWQDDEERVSIDCISDGDGLRRVQQGEWVTCTKGHLVWRGIPATPRRWCYAYIGDEGECFAPIRLLQAHQAKVVEVTYLVNGIAGLRDLKLPKRKPTRKRKR